MLRRILWLLFLLCWGSYSSALERVVIFSQDYCASCEVAKRYLEEKKVPYSEYNIDKSAAAMTYFRKLGGRGTPFLIVDNKKMQGFQADRFWQIYAEGTNPDMK